jgi:alcohol dehydrogenase class IV
MRLLAAQFGNLEKFTLGREERDLLLWASALAGIVIAHTGTTAVHSMGYSLTYFKNIDHGRANGLLLAEFLRFVQKSRPGKISFLLKALNLRSLDQFAQILNGMLGAREDITHAELTEYASIAVRAKNIGNCVVVPTERDLLDIYETVFKRQKG